MPAETSSERRERSLYAQLNFLLQEQIKIRVEKSPEILASIEIEREHEFTTPPEWFVKSIQEYFKQLPLVLSNNQHLLKALIKENQLHPGHFSVVTAPIQSLILTHDGNYIRITTPVMGCSWEAMEDLKVEGYQFNDYLAYSLNNEQINALYDRGVVQNGYLPYEPLATPPDEYIGGIGSIIDEPFSVTIDPEQITI